MLLGRKMYSGFSRPPSLIEAHQFEPASLGGRDVPFHYTSASTPATKVWPQNLQDHQTYKALARSLDIVEFP